MWLFQLGGTLSILIGGIFKIIHKPNLFNKNWDNVMVNQLKNGMWNWIQDNINMTVIIVREVIFLQFYLSVFFKEDIKIMLKFRE